MRTTSRPTALGRMLGVMAAIGAVVTSIQRRDRSLADQLRRAASSVALNLAEADGSDAGNRRARLRTALGSLKETRTAIEIAVVWGYTRRDTNLDDALDHVAAMTWRRLHPQR